VSRKYADENTVIYPWCLTISGFFLNRTVSIIASSQFEDQASEENEKGRCKATIRDWCRPTECRGLRHNAPVCTAPAAGDPQPARCLIPGIQ
jgi:hypothetical protein